MRMRDVWTLVQRTAPSITALRGAWSQLAQRRVHWQVPEGQWLEGAEEQWSAFARSILADHWEASGAALDALVEAAQDGILEWAIEWHLTWLKAKLEE